MECCKHCGKPNAPRDVSERQWQSDVNAEVWSMANQYRELITRFLDLVAADATFRDRLRSDPMTALEESGFARQMHEIQPDWELPEVTGYGGCADTCFNRWTCLSDSCYVTV
jgi:hypothetical protein